MGLGRCCVVLAIGLAGCGGSSDTGAASPGGPGGATATARVLNQSHFPVTSVLIDGVQRLPAGTGLPVGAVLDVGVAGGSHAYRITSATGFPLLRGWFFDDTFTAKPGAVSTIGYATPTLVDLLTDFRPSRQWTANFLNCNHGYAPENVAITFFPGGAWSSTSNTLAPTSGTVSLLSWPDGTSNIHFRLCPSCDAIQLDLGLPGAGDSFWYANGPSCTSTPWLFDYVAR